MDCLVLAYPCSFEGKLKQYIGRVQRSEIVPVIYDYHDLHITYLSKMYMARSKYYQKLKASRLIRVQEQYLLRFEEDRFYFGNSVNALPLSVLNLGDSIAAFKPGIRWNIKILKYDEATQSAFTEILNYNAEEPAPNDQLALPMHSFEQIRFNNVDTGWLLKSVIFKKAPPQQKIEPWQLFEKEVKIPFRKVQFENGCVKLAYYFSALKKDVVLEISNIDVRAEFKAVREYFAKVLKLKSVNVAVSIKYSKEEWKIISINAISEDINAINESVIDNVRFEFVRKSLFKFQPNDTSQQVQTLDQIQGKEMHALIPNEEEFLNQILKVDSARHYLQLKYLSTCHEFSILKLRFILQPFSFLFLIAGEKQYHVVWETLDSEEATYIWHIEKTNPALRAAVIYIEAALAEIKITGRQEYLKTEPDNFCRILHDYTDKHKGFIDWKSELNQRTV